MALTLIVAGCASPDGGANSQASQKPAEKTPEVGMSKEQVVAMFGKTDNIHMTNEGETWIYNLNMGEMFIPFNFGYRPKTRMIYFDKDSKVARWSYSK